MEIIEPPNINSLKDFIKYTDQYKNDNKLRLYRGQKEDFWDIESNLFLLAKSKKRINDFYEIEKRIFNSFKKELIRINPSNTKLSDWEVLSIGRHYGLPTRLVDWTSNPLIALWFAFEEEKDKKNDRAVWGLVVDENYLADFENDNPFNGRFIKVFQPNKIDNRIIAQESWFSVQNNTVFGKGGDGLPVFNEYNIISQMEEFDFVLVRIKIPNDQREVILNELNELGINRNTIYPDLQIICGDIEFKEFEE